MDEALLYLIAGFQKYADEDRRKIHEFIHYGYQQFIRECHEKNVIPPKNYQELIHLLRKPAKNWGFEKIGKYYPENSPMIDSHLRPVHEANELLYVIDKHADEIPLRHLQNHYQQLSMRKIYAYCKENIDDDNVYTTIRLFLSNPENAVLTVSKLDTFLLEITDKTLVNYIKECYESIKNIQDYRKCPYCHWTLSYNAAKQKWQCNYGSPCEERANLQHGVPFEEQYYALKFIRLKPGIQRFTLIPGISENRMNKRLQALGYQVQMYPNVDVYDLYAEKNHHSFKIDMKDYKNPSTLARDIWKEIQSKGETRDEEVIYVIPYEQQQRNNQYVMEVYNLLNDFKMEAEWFEPEVYIIDEKNFLKMVGDEEDEPIFRKISRKYS
ncbi:restriction endonuclease-related protein [Pseudogracilibacillus sp. ICA-222130]|uniref:restriction endonuclease-related protein n=1 Tax=Pseudogracilibacillus sp. ICA-222130 TaxID=3134655 RepID=UPI0030BAA58A